MVAGTLDVRRTRPCAGRLRVVLYIRDIRHRRSGMIQQRVRKVGNSFVVTIPKDEAEKLHITEGQLVGIEFTALEVVPVLRPDLEQAWEESWRRNEAGYRYLADR